MVLLSALVLLAFTQVLAATLATSTDLISFPLIKLHTSDSLLAMNGIELEIHQRHVAHARRRLALMSGPQRTRRRGHLVQKHHRRALLSALSGDETDSSQASSSDTTGILDANGDADALPSSLDNVHHRQSDAEVTKPRPVKSTNSAGLDIEGQDIGYFVVIPIGTPPRPFNLLVDSGSGDMWVGSESCRSDSGGGCGDHQLLGKKSSSSFQATDTPWSITYGKGAVSGRLARDHVVFPGRMRVENHTFGIAHNESAQFTSNESPLDGVLGCGKQSLAMQPTWTFLNALKAHGLIQNRTISYKISRIKDGDNDGEMTIGGMDHTKYDSGTLVEVPNVNKGGFWEASLDRIRVNQKDLGLHNRSCIFDTGTTLFVAPEPDVEVIHRTIPGAVFNDTTSSWALPCNTTTVISLGFGGKSFAIASEDLVLGPLNGTGMAMCASSIVQGGVEAGPMHWLVGDVWLKNVYISMKEDEDLISIARPR